MCRHTGPVNFNTDANNCGGCGQTCPAGQICYNWHCKDSIPAGWDTLCQYHDYYSSPAYTNLQADQYNCGRCGNWCGEHGSCIFGSCSYACTNPDGTIVHPNFYTDNQHCGQCGNACGAGSHCMEGVCMQNCPTSEYRRCPPGNSCMAIDVLNCHACGDACGENETCAYNPYSPLHYSCRCLPGYGTGTDGICVQFGTPEHCEGQSGTACPPGYKCLLTGLIFTAGACPRVPPDTRTAAGPAKTRGPIRTTAAGAGTPVRQTSTVTDGTCYNSCPVGTRVCPEWSTRTCVDITTDPFNCGSCGNDCGTGKVCVNGVCQDGCPLLPGDGARCQVGGRLVCMDLRLDDPMHCGNCSNVCLANQWCEDGVCNTCGADEIYCASGCQNVRSRGACGGSCTNRCQNDQVCYNDECRAFCPQGYNHCYNGICANFQTDSNHCGQCGHVCTGETFCHAGQCVTECPQWTTRCGDKCVGLGIDKDNCGSCGHVCDHMCVLGICI